MAIVKMKKLRLFVATPQRKKLLRELMLLGCVEVCEPPTPEEGETTLLRRTETPDLVQLRTDQTAFTNCIALLKKYAPEKGGLLKPLPETSAAQLLDESHLEEDLALARKVIGLDDRIRRLTAEESAKRTEIEALTPWKALDLPLECGGTGTTALVLGTFPGSTDLGQAQGALAEATELAELFTVYQEKTVQYAALVCFREDLDAAQAALRSFGFAAVSLNEFRGTAEENIRKDEARLTELAAEKETCAQQIVELAEHRRELELRADTMATKVARAEAEDKLLCTDCVSVLEGWVPAEKEPELESLLEQYDCAWETRDPEEDEYPEVPVELKDGKITRSLNTVTNMYSLPAYNGVDPNPWMTPFFILFYGMMLADMGYGLLMIIGCAVVLKLKKPRNREFFELFFWCGISATIWGAVTGGFFGDFIPQIAKLMNPNTTLTALPALFNPLNDAMPVLIGALALGLAQIFTGMAASIMMKIKRGEVMSAICGEVTWYVIFIILGVGLAMDAIKPALIAIVVLIVLTQGYGKEGIMGKVMGIFGSLYNNITGYFSDILSYSRLMALMLSGAVTAQVFNQLGAMTGNIVAFILISLIGNAINFGLNLLGCYVHDMRLQCLEFFGRFYEDGGKKFVPLRTDTTYYDIVNE